MSGVKKITVFACRWASYAGDIAAKNAGSASSVPPETDIIVVPCLGHVSAAMIYDAFRAGASGVLAVGCRIGNCHHYSGNLKFNEEMKKARKILGLLGVGADKLDQGYVHSEDGDGWTATIAEFAKRFSG